MYPMPAQLITPTATLASRLRRITMLSWDEFHGEDKKAHQHQPAESNPPPELASAAATAPAANAPTAPRTEHAVHRSGADSTGVGAATGGRAAAADTERDRKSTRLNSSHVRISYAVVCLERKSSQG